MTTFTIAEPREGDFSQPHVLRVSYFDLGFIMWLAAIGHSLSRGVDASCLTYVAKEFLGTGPAVLKNQVACIDAWS